MSQKWQGLPVWRVLDTDFGHGQAFFQTWLRWQQDTDRPRVLHYVAFCTNPVRATDLTQACQSTSAWQALAAELTPQWFGLLPGFHRFLLAQAQVMLTLCVGDTLKLLRQQQFAADALLFSTPQMPSDDSLGCDRLWLAKALTRCCRRGTRLQWGIDTGTAAVAWASALTQCGFRFEPPAPALSAPSASHPDAIFDPPWPLKNTRQSEQTAALPIQRCAVVGAGLAGASVAAALARRGWRVQVLDQGDTPAAGASGLPAGLVVPHVSSDDCSLSKLSRAGVRLMLQQARQHLEAGQQWSPSGVLERQVGDSPQLPPNWPDAGHHWSTPGSAAPAKLLAGDIGGALWHPPAAWIKPSALVRAWLRQPGVHFQGQAKVARLQRISGVWHLLDDRQAVLCRAECVVLANACGAGPLLQQLANEQPQLQARLKHLPASQGMRGLLSWAMHPDGSAAPPPFPAIPVNGSGSVMAHLPHDGGQAWFVGSSYQPEQQAERDDAANHARNFAHLQQLVPPLAEALCARFAAGQLNAWKGTRCVMADRLPVVGPLNGGDQPSLWICAGLGSRGLSFSVLCAELLAARMGAEPWPLETSLAKALNALRARAAIGR